MQTNNQSAYGPVDFGPWLVRAPTKTLRQIVTKQEPCWSGFMDCIYEELNERGADLSYGEQS